jgi:hypothetical protein
MSSVNIDYIGTFGRSINITAVAYQPIQEDGR